MVGVISHVPNPDVDQAVGLAQAAEAAGAEWIGVADAFWWRDVWMLLGEVASATERIELGPAMTNPYMRHRFHTASALATLQEKAHGRVFCGIAAGGSELTAAAGISRRDAAAKVTELVTFLREVAASGTLDAASGRGLDVDLDPVPILMAGRGDQMLRAAGAMADRVLLWAIPASDLERSASIVHDGAPTAPGRRSWSGPRSCAMATPRRRRSCTSPCTRPSTPLLRCAKGGGSTTAGSRPSQGARTGRRVGRRSPRPARRARGSGLRGSRPGTDRRHRPRARRVVVGGARVRPDNGRRPRRLGQLDRGPTRLSTAEPTGRDKRPAGEFRPVGCWRRRVQPSTRRAGPLSPMHR